LETSSQPGFPTSFQLVRLVGCGLTGRHKIASKSNDTLSNPANFMPPTVNSLFYAARCKAGGGNCLGYAMKNSEFRSECGRAKCFFCPSS